MSHTGVASVQFNICLKDFQQILCVLIVPQIVRSKFRLAVLIVTDFHEWGNEVSLKAVVVT